MSKLAFLLLLAGLGPTAVATTRARVEQVEQLLTAAHGQPDAKVAAKIADLELIERASSARLSHWQNNFPGKHTREALLALADASAFLDLPAAEIPVLAKPDAEARKQIFLRAIDYTNTTIHKLPNFSARRSTTHFSDLSVAQQVLDRYAIEQYNAFQDPPPSAFQTASVAQPLKIRNISSIVVTYRDGHEIADAPRKNYKNPEARVDWLTTSGEFGPILSVVIGDATNGKLYWGYWEQGASGPIAVYRYAVPKEMSHYTVVGVGDYPQLPAYHGEIAVDPAIGTILRVTIVAELKPPWQVYEFAIQVEYGPVEIGNAIYFCPVKGVALSKLPNSSIELAKENEIGATPTSVAIPSHTFVNDVSFTEYHVFRADVRVLP